MSGGPTFTSSLARFRTLGWTAPPCGTGFLIDRRRVITCAHVVNTALGRDRGSVARPGLPLRLDLPFVHAADIEASVVEWRAPVAYKNLEYDKPSDIAILRVAAK